MALRRLRAVARLVRAVGHGLHGLAIVLFRFPRLATAQRLARIRWWSRKMVHLLGIELRVEGTPLASGGLLAVNHISWLDIMVVHALVPEARDQRPRLDVGLGDEPRLGHERVHDHDV